MISLVDPSVKNTMLTDLRMKLEAEINVGVTSVAKTSTLLLPKGENKSNTIDTKLIDERFSSIKFDNSIG